MAHQRAFEPEPEQLEYIIQEHLNGKNINQLAKEFNVSFKTMKLTLLKTGKLKFNKNLKTLQGKIVDDIIEYYEKHPHITIDEIANKFNATYYMVRELLRDYYKRPLHNPKKLKYNVKKNNNT
ncbi:hypothetical protein GF412_05710 [Candidatus Micrarchaeota archaeon]|nr:hypothetical protein [Candidatus Micrarchaeota archaeon]